MNKILEIGERPLFKSLDLLEAIYLEEKKGGSGYNVVKRKYILKKIAEINIFLEILKNRNKTFGRQGMRDLFQVMIQLPLFFDKENVKKWEILKIWNNEEFMYYNSKLVQYNASFDTMTPSQLYQAKGELLEFVWNRWLELTPIDEIEKICELSINKLLNWEKERNELSEIEINLISLGNYINLSKKVALSWAYLNILTDGNCDLWDMYLNEFDSEDKLYLLIKSWEDALKLKHESINDLFSIDSDLVKYGFFKLNNIEKNWMEFWHKTQIINIPHINNKLIQEDDIIKIFLHEHKINESFPISWWDYLNIENLNEVIKSNVKIKVLILGESGTGKTSLLNSIINENKIRAFSILEHGNEKEEKIKNFKIANRLIKNIKDGALIIDNAENIYELKDNFESLNDIDDVLQFWSVSNKEKINKSFLKKFDFIIEMESPPLNKRTKLANKLFKDQNTAFRVAQTIKDPFEIMKTAFWCHHSNDWSWKNISIMISNFNKIKSFGEKDSFNINKLDNEGYVMPLVGYPQLEDLLKKLTHFYQNPGVYANLGAKADKGILLIGPPGTGKTHFARNLSKIINVPMFAPDTSLMAQNITQIPKIFDELKKHSPCILFLDEIDSLISSPVEFSGVNLEKQKIVNAFLASLDGVESNDGILVIGATHRDANFDSGAIRSGRMSKTIKLSLPNSSARREIWSIHLLNKPVSDLNMELLINLSNGFSCADIMESVLRATKKTVENNQESITMKYLLEACDEVYWGISDDTMIISDEQKQKTAYHEAGHALMAWKNNFDVQRITIRPRNNFLGAVQYVQEEGRFNSGYDKIKETIQMYLGGICGEKVKFGYYEEGGSGDLKNSRILLHNAICNNGLGKEGPIFLSSSDKLSWSNELKNRIEIEEKEIMNEQFNYTYEFINENKFLLDELAEKIIEERELSGEALNYFKNKVDKNHVIKLKNEGVSLHKK